MFVCNLQNIHQFLYESIVEDAVCRLLERVGINYHRHITKLPLKTARQSMFYIKHCHNFLNSYKEYVWVSLLSEWAAASSGFTQKTDRHQALLIAGTWPAYSHDPARWQLCTDSPRMEMACRRAWTACSLFLWLEKPCARRMWVKSSVCLSLGILCMTVRDSMISDGLSEICQVQPFVTHFIHLILRWQYFWVLT